MIYLFYFFKDMKTRAPEFFYSSISRVAGHDMVAVTLFAAALDELFSHSL
jgi:hypothetical protein